jgi:DNA-binding MarR family transcriptional regulator
MNLIVSRIVVAEERNIINVNSKNMKKIGKTTKRQNGMRKKSGELAVRIPEAGECNGTALRMATRRISQLYDVIFASSGLRSTQFSILTAIGRLMRPTIGELANSLVIDRSALAHNLKPLERNGLLQIIADDADKRSRLVVLTAAGIEKIAESLPLWEHAQRSFRDAYGTKNAEGLRAALKILASTDFALAFQGGKNLPTQDSE